MEVDGGHPQSMGLGITTPGVTGGGPHIPPPLQPNQQTIQHHGQPPTPTFSSMMGPSHPLQNPGQGNLYDLFHSYHLFQHIFDSLKSALPPSSPTSPPHTVQQQQQQHNISAATPTPQAAPQVNSGQAFFGSDMPSG